MITIRNLTVHDTESQKKILESISLTINPGEIHYIQGQNGSGKSTLLATIMGDPRFKIDSGLITLTTNDTEILLNDLSADERNRLGIFLAHQHPLEIPGLSLRQYLRAIYNARRTEKEKLPVFKFRKVLEEKAAQLNFRTDLLQRNLNEGFSGGEKKKTEILQLLITEPRIILLDEIDSGLDKQSIRDVYHVLKQYHETHPETSWIIVSHYDFVKEYLQPDFIHVMSEGRLQRIENRPARNATHSVAGGE